MNNLFFRRWFILSVLCLASALTDAQPIFVKLWPDGAPGAVKNSLYIERNWKDYYAAVSDPEIAVYPAPKDKATGTAVIICPGGGYRILCRGYEGTAIAEWLNSLGITGVILKYRLPSDSIMKDKTIGPLQDIQQAMRIVRKRATEWGIDTSKIGVIGFSAGGHLASTIATHYNDNVYDVKENISAKPDFAILIYPVITMTKPYTHAGSRKLLLGENPDTAAVMRFSNQYHVTPCTPPVFLVHSADDHTVPVINSIDMYKSLVNNKVKAEMHIFQQGGHGYGLAKGRKTESQWPELCANWLKNNGFLK